MILGEVGVIWIATGADGGNVARNEKAAMLAQVGWGTVVASECERLYRSLCVRRNESRCAAPRARTEAAKFGEVLRGVVRYGRNEREGRGMELRDRSRERSEEDRMCDNEDIGVRKDRGKKKGAFLNFSPACPRQSRQGTRKSEVLYNA